MQTIGNRIKIARKRLRLTQAQVAARCDDQISQGMVSDYERDEYKPQRDNVLILADALQVTPSWLEFGLNEVPQGDEIAEHPKPIRRAPVVDWVEAGRFAETADPYPVGAVEETVPVPTESETILALRVTGTSMDKEFPPGTIIIVDYSRKDLYEGKFYVFRVNGRATFKRWRESPRRLDPYSFDDNHNPIIPEGEVEVVGQVVHAQRDYR